MVTLDHCTGPETGGLRFDTRTEKEPRQGNAMSNDFTIRPATFSRRFDGTAISFAIISYTARLHP